MNSPRFPFHWAFWEGMKIPRLGDASVAQIGFNCLWTVTLTIASARHGICSDEFAWLLCGAWAS